eukprot:1157417-Pelagomonas_calceolata.AAC.5
MRTDRTRNVCALWWCTCRSKGFILLETLVVVMCKGGREVPHHQSTLRVPAQGDQQAAGGAEAQGLHSIHRTQGGGRL